MLVNFVNRFWHLMYEQSIPNFEESLDKIGQQLMNKVFTKVPYDQLFPVYHESNSTTSKKPQVGSTQRPPKPSTQLLQTPKPSPKPPGVKPPHPTTPTHKPLRPKPTAPMTPQQGLAGGVTTKRTATTKRTQKTTTTTSRTTTKRRMFGFLIGWITWKRIKSIQTVLTVFSQVIHSFGVVGLDKAGFIAFPLP